MSKNKLSYDNLIELVEAAMQSHARYYISACHKETIEMLGWKKFWKGK